MWSDCSDPHADRGALTRLDPEPENLLIEGQALCAFGRVQRDMIDGLQIKGRMALATAPRGKHVAMEARAVNIAAVLQLNRDAVRVAQKKLRCVAAHDDARLGAVMAGQELRQPRGREIIHRQAVGKDFRLGAGPRLGQREELRSHAEDGGIGLRDRRSKQLAIEGYGARQIRHRDHHIVVTPHSQGQSRWLGCDSR